MNTLLTPVLLDILTAEGYRYVLSKTLCLQSQKFDTAITLKPVKNRPAVRHLPGDFDTYFVLEQEPRQMAEGVDDTLIMVEINHEVLKNYIGYFLGEVN